MEDYTINNNNYENEFNDNHENQTINETEIDENSSVSYKEIYLIQIFKFFYNLL